MTDEEIRDKMQAAAFQPKKVVVDDKTVEQHDLDKLAEFDEYLAKRKALRNGGGVIWNRFRASGAI